MNSSSVRRHAAGSTFFAARVAANSSRTSSVVASARSRPSAARAGHQPLERVGVRRSAREHRGGRRRAPAPRRGSRRPIALDDRPQQLGQRRPAVALARQRPPSRVGELLQPADDERRDELVLGRELPVQARDAGACLGGDRRHRRLEPVACEHAPGGAQQPLALGVGVERRPLTLGAPNCPRLGDRNAHSARVTAMPSGPKSVARAPECDPRRAVARGARVCGAELRRDPGAADVPARRCTPPRPASTWLLTGFLLSASVGTAIIGRLGDMYGKERLLLWTLVDLAAGTLLAAVSNSLRC